MVLLFFLLLLASFGKAEFASEVDCDKNRCFVLVTYVDSTGTAVENIWTSMNELKDERNQLQMLVEIDTRSAHHFDFRVFYDGMNITGPTEMNITGLLNITTERVTMTLNGKDEDLPITDISSPSGGDEMTANFSSFRFSMEVEIEKNLFTKFSESDEVLTFQRDRFKVIKRGIQTCLNNSKRKATLTITPKIVGSCSSRLCQQDPSDEEWLWVNGVECNEGYWLIRRKKENKWNVMSTRLYCGKRPPSCSTGSILDFSTGSQVTIILLGMYCACATLILIALFIVLYHKLDDMTGPSRYKIVRMKGTREGQPSSSGSSSGSSSENEVDLASRFKQVAKINQKLKKKKNQLAIANSIETSQKAKAVKKNQDQKKEKAENSKSGKSGTIF